jgi:hypothetical protein
MDPCPSSLGIAQAPDEEKIMAIIKRAHALLYEDDLVTCAVCDEARFSSPTMFWQTKRHTTLPLNEMPAAAYSELEPPEEDLHPDLLAQYNVASLAPPAMASVVSNLLLSPRGITKDGEATICNTCLWSLQEGNLPKFAIANGSVPRLIYSHIHTPRTL